MAKGLRSKAKKANRSEMRKKRIEPELAKRQKTLARLTQRAVIEKKDASGLMQLVKPPFQQGFKSGFKKPVFDMGEDADIDTEPLGVDVGRSVGHTHQHGQGSFGGTYFDNDAAKERKKRHGGRRPADETNHSWFKSPTETKEKAAATTKPKKTRAARK